MLQEKKKKKIPAWWVRPSITEEHLGYILFPRLTWKSIGIHWFKALLTEHCIISKFSVL